MVSSKRESKSNSPKNKKPPKRNKGENIMKNISINNGATYTTIEDALANCNWDAIVQMMDDEIREQVANAIAPCTNEEFLAEYLRRASEDLIIG